MLFTIRNSQKLRNAILRFKNIKISIRIYICMLLTFYYIYYDKENKICIKLIVLMYLMI